MFIINIIENVCYLWICIGVELAPWDLWLVGKGLQVAPRLLVDDAVEVVGSGRAEDAEDVVELVKVVLAREYWPEQSNVNSIYFLTSLDLLCPLNNQKKHKTKKNPTEIPAYIHIL